MTQDPNFLDNLAALPPVVLVIVLMMIVLLLFIVLGQFNPPAKSNFSRHSWSRTHVSLSGKINPKTLLRLPPELEVLDVSCSDIEEIVALPPRLLKLYARNCKNLKKVCELPDSVEDVDFTGCEQLQDAPTAKRRPYLLGDNFRYY